MPKTHESLCPVRRWPKSHFMFCHCNLIRQARAQEQERIVNYLETVSQSECAKLVREWTEHTKGEWR